jgi:hypoxia up-regulated 1
VSLLHVDMSSLLTTRRLDAFDASDKSRRDRAEILNSLEAFTYRARDYFDDEAFISSSTPDVRATLEEKLSAASAWMESDGAEAGEKDLRAKLKELEDIVNPVLRRRRETRKRPAAITQLEETITGMKEVMELVDNQIKEQVAYSSKSAEAASSSSASPSATPSTDPLDELEEADSTATEPELEIPEVTEVPTIYSAADLTRLQDITAAAKKWLEDGIVAQEKLTEHDDPAIRVQAIEAEKKKLDDLVIEMMMKKMKHFKPPKANAPPKSKSSKPTNKARKSKKGGKKEDADAKTKADKQAEVLKSFAAGSRPSEAEVRAAMEKAGVEWDPVKDSKKTHDEL